MLDFDLVLISLNFGIFQKEIYNNLIWQMWHRLKFKSSNTGKTTFLRVNKKNTQLPVSVINRKSNLSECGKYAV